MCGKGGMHGEGVMHGEGEHAWQGGVHGKVGMRAGETATAVGGMHPTGIHSCSFLSF